MRNEAGAAGEPRAVALSYRPQPPLAKGETVALAQGEIVVHIPCNRAARWDGPVGYIFCVNPEKKSFIAARAYRTGQSEPGC